VVESWPGGKELDSVTCTKVLVSGEEYCIFCQVPAVYSTVFSQLTPGLG
jgi:hypothetical protein